VLHAIVAVAFVQLVPSQRRTPKLHEGTVHDLMVGRTRPDKNVQLLQLFTSSIYERMLTKLHFEFDRARRAVDRNIMKLCDTT
jgi:hypothetical protein